jgi:hypothetical protein
MKTDDACRPPFLQPCLQDIAIPSTKPAEIEDLKL